METIVALNKKTGKGYIKAEVDKKLPHMTNVRRTNKDGDYHVYTDSVYFLKEGEFIARGADTRDIFPDFADHHGMKDNVDYVVT